MLGAVSRACSSVLRVAKPALAANNLQNVGSKTLPALFPAREYSGGLKTWALLGYLGIVLNRAGNLGGNMVAGFIC